MTKLKKTIASFVACVLMMSMLTLDVMAASVTFTAGDATVIGTLDKTSTSATASVSAFHKILCKSKSNQTKGGLQCKQGLGFPLNCNAPAG